MTLSGFQGLFDEADRRRPQITAVAAGAADPTVLRAMQAAAQRGWIRPVAVGRGEEIEEVARCHRIALQHFEILDSTEPARAAVAAVRAGHAQLLMKGKVSTPELMRALLDPSCGLRTQRVVCQVVLMEIPRDQRRFLLADTGICINPSLEQRLDILRSTVDLARSLGSTMPRVALMAATETVDDRMPETRAAEALACQAAQNGMPCHVQGPLSFDLAYAADAGEKKRMGGEVVGAAEIMIFPNLLAANLVVKAIMYTADCRFGGVLRGAACPVVFMSRADTSETRLNSIALAVAC